MPTKDKLTFTAQDIWNGNLSPDVLAKLTQINKVISKCIKEQESQSEEGPGAQNR